MNCRTDTNMQDACFHSQVRRLKSTTKACQGGAFGSRGGKPVCLLATLHSLTMARRVEVHLEPIFTPKGDIDGAYCSVLRVDDAVFLLDCGWSAAMRVEDLIPLKRCVRSMFAACCLFGGC